MARATVGPVRVVDCASSAAGTTAEASRLVHDHAAVAVYVSADAFPTAQALQRQVVPATPAPPGRTPLAAPIGCAGQRNRLALRETTATVRYLLQGRM